MLQRIGRIMVLAGLVAASGGLAAPVSWPGDARVAVTVTFDLDAETVWWRDAESMTGNPSSLSQGHYGPTVAVPKILAVLARRDIRATFFIPSWVAETYPDVVRQIVEAGHEVGAHGVRHESPVSLAPEREAAVLAESIATLERVAGTRPLGYRAPSWAFSEHTLGYVEAAGFRYSSNLMDADWPYVHPGTDGLVELPVSWVLDDAPYFWFDEDSWNRKIHSAAEVRAIWQEEAEAIIATGGYLDLTMHPQIIGRPARLRMLDAFLGWLQAQDAAWIATGSDVANAVRGD